MNPNKAQNHTRNHLSVGIKHKPTIIIEEAEFQKTSVASSADCHYLPTVNPKLDKARIWFEASSSESKSEEAANCLQMGDTTFLDRMLLQLRSTCKYYSGYPKDLGPSRVLHFTSEREFVQLLHQGYPVVVAFTIRSNYTQHLDRMLEEAAAEFYPNIKFMRVECPKYPGFCITRQKSEYPFIEIFHSPQQAGNEGKVQDPNITRYSVKVVPYNYDMSPYGFREFFKRQGVRT